MYNTTLDIDQIIELYSDMVYKLAFAQTKNKSDADDVFQEVFLRYVKNNKEFINKEHEKAWFIRVTINCCKNIWRSAWFRHREYLNEEIEFETKEESEIYEVLVQLPKKYRLVIHLFYYEDMSIAEISNVINIKESTIRTQLTRGRKMLKEKLKGDYYEL